MIVAELTVVRSLERYGGDGLLDPLVHAVLENGLLATDLLEGKFAARVVEFFEAIEAVARVARHLAGLADAVQ